MNSEDQISLWKFFIGAMVGLAGFWKTVDAILKYVSGNRKDFVQEIVKIEVREIKEDIIQIKENRIIDNQRILIDNQNMHNKLNEILEEIRSNRS